jgi:hypothetical protein
MDFGWSEREELLRKSVKEFAESEISPKIDAMEETGNFPTELLASMAKMGITGIIAPPEYSGVGLGYLARTGQVFDLPVEEEINIPGPRVLEVHIEEPEGMPMEKAEVVVAGGWGIGGVEGWQLLEELARLLCGAVGATRPPVDEGWALESQMIGQSGKTIRPRLYIGAGISGMTHHVVGMDGSDCIVAINTNLNAAIFAVSDITVVADYREIIPLLIKEIRARLQDSRIDTCEMS